MPPRSLRNMGRGPTSADALRAACEPPTHLAVTTQDEAGTWRLEATLTPVDADHTRLRFVHHLEDGDNASEVGPGWEYYLATLESAMAGGPRPEWDDYWPRLSAAYA